MKEGALNKKNEEEASAKIKEAIKYFQKYRELAKSIGQTAHVTDAEAKIAQAKGLDPLDESEVKANLPLLRARFEKYPGGANYSNLILALRMEGHEIEVETVMAKELGKNRRLLGPDHPTTKEVEYALKCVSVRRVSMHGVDGKKIG